MAISVIIPAHNAEKTIEKTLLSLAAQTIKALEIIVVDDGSEKSLEAIRKTSPISFELLHIPHHGAAAARNFGAAIAKRDLLFFCDADVILVPTFLEKLSEALYNHPKFAFAYCSFEWHGNTFIARPFSVEELKKNNYISTMSILRRDAFPGFDESLPRFQDWDLWLTIAERSGKGFAVPEILFHVSEEGLMSRRGGLSRLKATKKIRQKHRLPWQFSDFWLAFKESVRARRV